MALGEHALTMSHVLDVRKRKQDLTIDAQPFFCFPFAISLSLIPSSKPSRQWQSRRDDNSSTWTGFDLFCEKKTSGATEMDAPQDNLTLK